MDQIAEIFWDSGYSQAVAEVKAEHEERLQKGMAAAIGLSPIMPEIEGNGDETVPNHINPYS